jgi:A118 family predicted phage portal protein
VKSFFNRVFNTRQKNGVIGADIIVSNKMEQAIKQWCEMLTPEYGRLHVANSVSSELARLVTIEMKSEITGNDFLNGEYKRVLDDIRRVTQFACAKGGIVFKPYISDGKIIVDYVHADRFYPTAFTANEITGAVFVEQHVRGRNYLTRLEYHDLNGTTYTIRNKSYTSTNKDLLGNEIPLESVEMWAELQPEVTLTGLQKPLFSYFKMPFANTIDSDSPLGVSAFFEAVSLIEDLEEQYLNFKWEYKSAQRKIIASVEALKRTNVDNIVKWEMPEREKGLYIALDSDEEGFYHEFSPAIRETNIINGINEIYRMIEQTCGLSRGTLSEIQDTAKTATEIKMSKQRSYSTVVDIQKNLQSALTDLIEIMSFYAKFYKLATVSSYEASFEFDDSLVVDTESEQKIWFAETGAGLMKPTTYLMKRYGVTEEQATEMLPNAFNEGDT